MRQRVRDAGHCGVADRDQNATRVFVKLARRNGGDSDEFGRARGAPGAPTGDGYNRFATLAKQSPQSLRHTASSGDANRFLKTSVHVRNSTDSFEKTRTAAKNATHA